MKFLLCLTTAFALNAADRFEEKLYPSWTQSFEVTKMIHREKSDFWDLAIFENSTFGKVLAIDGIIQTTENDEPFYHEMMVHVPILAHGDVTAILIIGGGDGGALREALRHSKVEKAVLVEIDRRVMDLCKQHMPALSNGAFADPRVEIVIQDAAQYVKDTTDTFDVIICDSCDPYGACAPLFSTEFYGACKAILNPGGILVNQNGVPVLQKEELKMTYDRRKKHFKHVAFYTTPVPTYTGGFMALGWASDRKHNVSEKTLATRLAALKGKMKYYTPAIHRASFSLPQYMLDVLSDNRSNNQ